mgnify:CR=1 FL=1
MYQISIPNGSIKRTKKIFGFYKFKLISIPNGSIKSNHCYPFAQSPADFNS